MKIDLQHQDYFNGSPFPFDLMCRKIGYVNGELADVMMRFLEPGHVCVDAGANCGDFTWIMARMIGARGMILAFEPDTTVFKELEENTGALINVERRREALWICDTELTFHRSELSGYSSFEIQHPSVEHYTVQCRSLDSFLLAPHPNFLKVDCEGADEMVLRGAEGILRKGVDCVLAELHYPMMPKFQCSEQSMREYMLDLGYDCFLLEGHRPPLHMRPGEKITRMPKMGIPAVNVMFAKASRVEELWQLKKGNDNG